MRRVGLKGSCSMKSELKRIGVVHRFSRRCILHCMPFWLSLTCKDAHPFLSRSFASPQVVSHGHKSVCDFTASMLEYEAHSARGSYSPWSWAGKGKQ